MPWHTQWSAPALWQNWLPARPLEDLRLAFKERADAAGETMPIGWQASFLTSNYLLSAADLAAFQAKMSTVFSWYIDHTKTYDGTATAPELWTEETISAKTTAGTRLAAPTAGFLLGNSWLFQQYELINLLRWVKISEAATSYAPAWGIPGTSGKALAVTSAMSWADAVNKFKTGLWGPGYDVWNALFADKDGSTWRIFANGWEYGINEATAQTLQYSVDAYWREVGEYATFRALGPQDTAGAWNLLFALGEGNGGRAFTLIPDATYNTAIDLFTDPAANSQGSISYGGTSIIVGRFDGPNGFTYKNW